jgi:hypothetical protein
MHMSQSCRFIKPKYDFFPTKKVSLFTFAFLTFDISSVFRKTEIRFREKICIRKQKIRNKKKLFSEVVGRTHRGVRRLSRPLRQHLVRWKFRFFHRKVKLANPRIFKSDVSTFRRIYSFFSKLFFFLSKTKQNNFGALTFELHF